MKRFIARLLGFSALPLISALTPLMLLPIVARIGGPDGWASISLGQAVGAIGSVAIGYGSMIWGPPSVAVAVDHEDRRRIYLGVTSSKALISVLALPAVMLVTAAISPSNYVLEAVGMALSMAIIGWSPSWYLIGLGTPKPIAKFETIPKLIATALSAVLLLTTGMLWTYPLFLIVASAAGVGLFHRKYFGRAFPGLRPFSRSTFTSLRSRWHTALIDATGTAYVAAPIPVASVGASTQEISAVASGDKLYRYGLFAISALGNAFQGWVLERSGKLQLRRQAVAVGAHAALGLVGLLVLSAGGPWLTGLLFGPMVAASNPLLAFYGIAYFAVSASTPFVRNVLIPAGKTKIVLGATIAGALVGVPSMLILNAHIGPAGVALGLAISEVLVLIATVGASVPSLAAPRGRRRHGAHVLTAPAPPEYSRSETTADR